MEDESLDNSSKASPDDFGSLLILRSSSDFKGSLFRTCVFSSGVTDNLRSDDSSWVFVLQWPLSGSISMLHIMKVSVGFAVLCGACNRLSLRLQPLNKRRWVLLTFVESS